MRPAFALTLMLLLAASPGYAQQGGWHDEKGTLVPDSQSRKSSNGFGGSILVTPDADWKKKWNTPAAVTPQFSEVGTIQRGKKVWLLIFFANPKLDAGGNANIVCDLKFTRPDGATSFEQKNLTCFKGRLGGDPHLVYMAGPTVEFIGEPADPEGTWRVSVKLRDMNQRTQLSLLSAFTLRK